MNIRELFPKFDVKVTYRNLEKTSGEYWYKSDFIVLDYELKKSLPGCAKIVMLHEMFHSTASNKRLLRKDRLEKNYGVFTEGSLSHRMEECIAEIATLVATMKLGLLNEYSRNVILPGLKKNYTPDMSIPVREVRAALKYFAEDSTSFEEELEEIKTYLDAYMDIKFTDTYPAEAAG